MIQKKRLDELLVLNGISDLEKEIDHLYDLAYENMDNEAWVGAAQLFLSLLSYDNDSAEAMNGLGVCLFEMGNLDDAEYIINRTLSINPDDPVTLANKASICWEQDLLEDALCFYGKALEIEPNLIEAKINIVNLHRETGDIFIAYTQCLELAKSFPDDEEIKELLDSIILDLAIMFY